MLEHINTPALSAVVRAQSALGDRRARALHRIERRLGDETGAQTAEYAMLGGVSAAACGVLIAILREGRFLDALVDALLGGLTKLLRTWF